MSDTNQPTLLVTGASGILGQRVLELLLAAGGANLIGTTRSPGKLADFADQGVTVREADFNNPTSLATAFAGADRLLLISTDVIGQGDLRQKQHTAAVRAAEEAGVQHVVYTSLYNATDTPVRFAPDHATTEAALANSSMGYTILRNNIYMDMLPGSIAQAYERGGLFSAAGDGKIAYISREDCAQAAAAALSSDFEGRRVLDITGAQAYSQADVAAAASAVTGKPLNYVPVELEAALEAMVNAGLPRHVAEIYVSLDEATREGKLAGVSDDYKALTGRTAITLPDFLALHQDALA